MRAKTAEATDMIGNERYPAHRRGAIFFLFNLVPSVREEENKRLERFEAARAEQERVNHRVADFLRSIGVALKDGDRNVTEKTIELGKVITPSQMAQLPAYKSLEDVVIENGGKLLVTQVDYKDGEIRMSEDSRKYKLIVTW